MTVLSLAQTLAQRLQLSAPSSIIGSTDANVILMKTVIEQAAQDIASEYAWPEITREYTFTLATNIPSYAVPADYDRYLTQTLWNRTQKWPLIGPLTPQEWQTYKSGLVTTLPRQRFRLKYWGDTQFFIDPTPTSSENGQTVAFEYISKTVFRPKTWIALTSWAGLQYCSYNGNIYDRGGTGAATTGTTAPTHTSGSVSDGSITWTYYASPFETINNDNDETTLDPKIIIDSAFWRFLQARGQDFEDYRAQADEQKELAKTRLQGAGILTIGRNVDDTWLIGPWSYKEGDYYNL